MIERLNAKAVTVRYHLRQLRQEGRIEPTTQQVRSPNVRYRLIKTKEK
ncbi:hypothetical protein HRbin16_00193 [bacterium HR16]|nr:hypothetical protein HRbin16_00193 [bacterium HR16]